MRLPVHGYLEGPRPVFATYHAPAADPRDVAYVICPPLGWESIQCYHALRVMGETLGAAGFPTLRVAYDGTGESTGHDEDGGRVEAWIESIGRAVDALRTLPGIRGVGLVGIRMGATLAARFAASTEVASLALWEPCPSGAFYGREMEILASAAAGKAGSTPPAGEPDRDPVVEAGGYVLTSETLADLAGLDLLGSRPLGCPEVLVMGRDDRGAPTRLAAHFQEAGCRTRVERPAGYKEMMVYPERSVPSLDGIRTVVEWAKGGSAPAGAVQLANGDRPEWLAEDVSHGGIRNAVRSFGPGGRLFGVVTEPERAPAAEHPAVLLLTGGVVPRTAVNRLYIVLAERLAERGHRVLRFDVSGIGESLTEPGHPGRDPYPPGLLDDAAAAAALLTGGEVDRPVWLVGLCSGAYAAFQTALTNPRVAGAVLLNPIVYRLEGGSFESSDVQQSADARHYRAALFRWETWRKALRGGVDLRRPLKLAARRSGAWLSARWQRLTHGAQDGRAGVPGLFSQLLERGTEVHVLFSEGDPGIESLAAQTGESLASLERAGLRVETVPGADHTFNARLARRRVTDRILQLIPGSDGDPR